MSHRLHRIASVMVALALLAGCATGQAVHNADKAAERGDWDSAVTFYRQALTNDPNRPDLKIKLDRASRNAAAEHIRRARELERQDQLSGALAEYKLAADLDPSSTLALARAAELDRRIREQAEAARPRPRADTLRQQAQQASPIPRLDPRTPLTRQVWRNAAIRDILSTVATLTGINVTYDQGLDGPLSRPYTLDTEQTPLEEVLLQVLQANALTFKIINARTIFVYQDNPTNRLKYEDQYIQTFFLSNADPTELQTSLNALLSGTQIPVRPVFTPNKAVNALTVKATAPVMAVIENYVRQMDRAVPEVLIEAEILEVDRNFMRKIGLDLNQWAIGLAFSPEVAPAVAAGTFPPANPPPYNLNTISRGVSPNDFYMTTPAAMIQLLESNTNTRILARPSQRGQAGKPIQLKLGDQIPIPTTVFNSGAAGGIANIPTTSVQYQSVGVNLIFTPRVTYNDEIVLDQLTLEKSGLGANLDVGGQSFPTIISRRADTTIRLRDGESTLISGLLKDDERNSVNSFPGISGIPILRSLFGNTTKEIEQSDIVMIITPHIVRGHEMTANDYKPMYIGTGQNIGSGNEPGLLSPDALNPAGTAPSAAPVLGGPATAQPPQSTTPQAVPAAPIAPVPPGAPGPTPPPIPQPPSQAPAPTPQGRATPPQGPEADPIGPTASGARAPGVVPIQPVNATGAAPTRAIVARVSLTPPAAGPDGVLPAGGGPHTMPIQVADINDVATIALSISYDPAIIKAPTVTQGSFMMQGGVMVTFIPSVNASAGRIDIAISRPMARTGAVGTGLLAAISFTAGAPGVTDLTVTGVATTPSGQSIPLQFAPSRITVR